MTQRIPKHHSRLVQHCTTARAHELQTDGWTIEWNGHGDSYPANFTPHIAWKLVKDGEQ